MKRVKQEQLDRNPRGPERTEGGGGAAVEMKDEAR